MRVCACVYCVTQLKNRNNQSVTQPKREAVCVCREIDFYHTTGQTQAAFFLMQAKT